VVAELAAMLVGPVASADGAATCVALGALLEAVGAVDASVAPEHDGLVADAGVAGGAAELFGVAEATEGPDGRLPLDLQPFDFEL